MKVELKDAKVELEVGKGKSTVYINGQSVPIPKEVSFQLIFGDDERPPPTPTPPTPLRPGLVKAKEIRRGCQSPSSKRKLSASLKKYHAKKRRKEKAEEKLHLSKPSLVKAATKKQASGKHLNGRSMMNGAGAHIN